MEIWATFDFYREVWQINPFNPKNNSNYDYQRTDLIDSVPTHPIFSDNPFFTSIPSHRNNMRLLEFQQKFVDKLLSYALNYDHVLYCMDNETSVTSSWGAFWSTYLKKRAREEGKQIYCTEMWDPWDLNHISHRESFDHPELYEFVEISQNNHQVGEKHWSNGLHQIARLKALDNLRPVTNIKIYGSDQGRHGGSNQDAMEKFFRALLFGASSARFHRPPSGIGLSREAQQVIRSMRTVLDQVSFFEMVPLDVLTAREENEAYVRGLPGKEYVIYFTRGGSVHIAEEGKWNLSWREVLADQTLTQEEVLVKNHSLELTCPGDGQWLLILKKAK
jgi:hypothetical protein